MIDRSPPPSRSQINGGAVREIALALLAFAAGFGTYMGQLKEPPRWPQDYFAATGAGALLSLAKLLPAPGGTQGGKG